MRVFGGLGAGGTGRQPRVLRLYAFQYRGQESAGTAVADGRGMLMYRGDGMVSQV
jgi:glutamine phosphoribosylpyrophosphate amidotransferase